MAFPCLSRICFRIQISATRVLPLAVGLARTRFFPSKTPALIASSWGGANRPRPSFSHRVLTLGSNANSLIITLSDDPPPVRKLYPHVSFTSADLHRIG